MQRNAVFLPLECREPVRSYHDAPLCCGCFVADFIPDVVRKSCHSTLQYFCVVSSLLTYNIYIYFIGDVSVASDCKITCTYSVKGTARDYVRLIPALTIDVDVSRVANLFTV